MGSLTGGERDEDPPEVISSEPENYSVNFEGQEIEITFDEFIQLNNINQELIISPPLENRPVVRLKNKSILIELENELKENTTYTLNFGEAIKDNNEGNELTNFEFVFSTGDYLDSLSLGGKILRAFDLEFPEEPVNIMLYTDLSDSVVFREIPLYIGKSGKEGTYRINNLRADTFKLFALKDVNNNFLFDLPNEQIAFLDTSIIVTPEFFSQIEEELKDTATIDSLSVIQADKLAISDTVNLININEDSLMIGTDQVRTDRIFVDLYLFTEDSESQFLSDYNRKTRRKLDFAFNQPVTDSFSFYSLIPDRQNWYLKEIGEENKSFVLWIVDDEVMQMDSIEILMQYVVEDSTSRNVWKKDTVRFFYRDVTADTRKPRMEEGDEKSLEIITIRNKAILELNERSEFISETPVNFIDTSHIKFYKIIDTLELREPFNIFRDSVNIRTIIFDKDWESGARYHFYAYPGAFMDVYGATNDTIQTEFSVREEEFYGTLIVNVDTVTGPLVIQLLDTNDKVLEQKSISEKEEVRFSYLEPGKFKLKLIYDRNGNSEWDTGNYTEGRQPEKVQFYPGEINVRANWELGINVKTRDP